MSTFNRFCAKARNAVRIVGSKAEEMVDSASKVVKIKALEIRIDEQYEKLGALVYRDLHTEENLEEEKLQIIATIDGLFDELAVLKEESETAEEAEASTVPDESATDEEKPIESEATADAE